MKKLFYLFIIFLSIIFFSCKKEPKKHKITYEVNFFQTPSTGSSNFIGISTMPLDGNRPGIDRFNIPKTWRYECYNLIKGDEIVFAVNGQLSYFFEMRLYIDDKQVSYLKAKVSDNSYYAVKVLEVDGLNDYADKNVAMISFVYQE